MAQCIVGAQRHKSGPLIKTNIRLLETCLKAAQKQLDTSAPYLMLSLARSLGGSGWSGPPPCKGGSWVPVLDLYHGALGLCRLPSRVDYLLPLVLWDSVGTPSGASLLLLLGWMRRCHQDVWSWTFDTLVDCGWHSCPASISVCLQASWGHCCSFLPSLSSAFVTNTQPFSHSLTLSLSISLSTTHTHTHTIGRLIYHFVNGVKTRSSRAAELLLPQIIF